MELTPAFPRLFTIFLVTVLSLSIVGTAAEDGTSGTLPESLHQCEIVEANWSAPVASPESSPSASPVASPEATPVAVSMEETEELTADLEAATQAILNCMSSNNLETLLEVTGEDFRGTWLGLGTSISDDDFSILLPMLTNLPYALIEIEDATADGETATAIVKYTTGRQLITSEWTYALVTVDGQNVWQVQQETLMPTEAPENAVSMSLIIDDGTFFLDSSTYPSGDIVIDVVNIGTQPHEALIVRVPAGTEASDFAAAPSGIPAGGTFVAQVTVPAERGGTIVLTDVRAGTYTVVDLLPGESGLPNVTDGMITEFTVD